MTFQHGLTPMANGVPDVDPLIVAPDRQEAPVPAPGQAIHRCRMLGIIVDKVSRFDIENQDRVLVFANDGNLPAVGVEGGTPRHQITPRH